MPQKPCSARRRLVASGSLILPVVSILAVLLPRGAAAGGPQPGEVVVVANRNVPESLELARHYIVARGIPAGHLCALDLPGDEVISRRKFDQHLRDPLLEFLRKGGLIKQERVPSKDKDGEAAGWKTVKSSVRYLVSIYGVPVRIAESRWDSATRWASSDGVISGSGAAVDSELTMLLMPPYDLEGPVGCPLFGQIQHPAAGAKAGFFLVATRLDGPEPDAVRKMINDTMAAERYGLLGRAYFDSRGMTDTSYQQGDYWLQEASERFAREGYDCILDRGPALWSMDYPMESVAVYLGWYTEHVTGPFQRASFRFMPGALAYHIHSTSAERLRSATRFWVGPLLARGATATMGAVGEPFLGFTPQLHILADRLCRGYNFGDSVYMSLQVVSWQVTVVGDPLYRPFLYPLAEQIRHLEEDQRPEVEWAYLREVNLLVREGRFNVAMDYCRAKLKQRDSVVLREKLGDLYARNDLFTEAGREYEAVLKQATTAETAVRVGMRWMLILRLLGDTTKADLIEAGIRKQWQGSPILAWLEMAQP